jgi:hypothetical protein
VCVRACARSHEPRAHRRARTCVCLSQCVRARVRAFVSARARARAHVRACVGAGSARRTRTPCRTSHVTRAGRGGGARARVTHRAACRLANVGPGPPAGPAPIGSTAASSLPLTLETLPLFNTTALIAHSVQGRGSNIQAENAGHRCVIVLRAPQGPGPPGAAGRWP